LTRHFCPTSASRQRGWPTDYCTVSLYCMMKYPRLMQSTLEIRNRTVSRSSRSRPPKAQSSSLRSAFAHSIIRAGCGVASVGTVVVRCADWWGCGRRVDLSTALLPKFVRCVVLEECSEAFPAMCISLLASNRRDSHRTRHAWQGERTRLAGNIVDLARFRACMPYPWLLFGVLHL
jgi:hypothetical protein